MNNLVGAGAASMRVKNRLEAKEQPGFGLAFHNVYHFECRDKDGNLKWEEWAHNLVVTEGRNNLIDVYLRGSTQDTTWFLGLKGAGTIAASDTLASHAGWTEITAYTGNRGTLTFAAASGGSSAATGVAFAITGSATVAGAFIAGVNTGTSGVLFGVSDFASSRAVENGDTLTVTPTVSITSS